MKRRTAGGLGGFCITPILRYSITPFRRRIIGQLHHVKEAALALAHVQDIDLRGVRTGNRLESPDAIKLALVRTVAVEGFAIDDLHRAAFAHDVPRQPHLAVAAAPNPANQFMIWYRGARVSTALIGT